MNDLQEELTSARIENDNSSVDGFGRQISLKGLVDGDTVHIAVINKPAQECNSTRNTHSITSMPAYTYTLKIYTPKNRNGGGNECEKGRREACTRNATHKPNDLVAEKLSVILRRQVRFSWL